MASNFIYSQRYPSLKKRDDFEDLLEERKKSSDLRYAFKCYSPVLYKGVTPCTASKLKDIVLQSDQLHYVIKQLSKETGEVCEVIQEEASAILDEMAHLQQTSTVRFLAFCLTKVFKTIFQGIRVNEEGIQRLQQAIQEHPVVLLPSHRSYMDFLLMSYILFTYDLTLPVIAAGMDFLGMKFLGEMLRMSGAFFIRRSFGGDKLYWAVFSEYVKTMLRSGFAPIEFFLEGTRSRTCKSLTPKLGLLNIVMEPFLKGEVFDVSFVPVSISYERILEENLYARELLGVPKPKESTSGLLKARKILSENYGKIHVYFGQPVSVRSLAHGRVNRAQYNLLPRHIPRRPSMEAQTLVNDVAYRVVRLQEENMVLTPWVLMALLLLQHQNQTKDPDMGMEVDLLTKQTLWLRGLAQDYGAFLDWPDHLPPASVVSSSLSLHKGLVGVSGGRVRLLEAEASPGSAGPEDRLFSRAVGMLACGSYRNQVLHVLLRPALLATAMRTASSSKKEVVYNCFSFLRNIFSNEFILCPGDTVQDFEEACYLLVKTGVVQVLEQDLLGTDGGQNTLSFLTAILQPFVQGYQLVCRYLCEEAEEGLTEKQFVPAFRSFAVKVILAGNLRCYEVLSSDLQKNALAALLRVGAVQKVKGANQVTLKVNKMVVNSLEDTMGGKLPTPKAVPARL